MGQGVNVEREVAAVEQPPPRPPADVRAAAGVSAAAIALIFVCTIGGAIRNADGDRVVSALGGFMIGVATAFATFAVAIFVHLVSVAIS